MLVKELIQKLAECNPDSVILTRAEHEDDNVELLNVDRGFEENAPGTPQAVVLITE